MAAAIVKGDVRLGCAAFDASLRRARTAAANMQPRGRVRSTANAQRTVGNEIPRRALRDKIRRIEKEIDFSRAAANIRAEHPPSGGLGPRGGSWGGVCSDRHS